MEFKLNQEDKASLSSPFQSIDSLSEQAMDNALFSPS
jgi:hypothetical protein